MARLSFLPLFLLFLWVSSSLCLIHTIRFKKDTRTRVLVENFGFEAAGIWNVTATGVEFAKMSNGQLSSIPFRENSKVRNIGLIARKTNVDATLYIEGVNPNEHCMFDTLLDSDIVLHFDKENVGPRTSTILESGFYNTYFVNCEEGVRVSFKLILSQKNVVGGVDNYLPAGRTLLPTVFAFVSVLYIVCLIIWIMTCIKTEDGSRVFLIHHLMTALLVVKFLSVFFKAVELHYLKINGHSGGWAVLYFFFTFLKGIMMFVVIALVGSGWTFIKNFLSDKEKKIFMIVIPLQILDNIALVVVEEMAPGSLGWFKWKDIFRLVDIICCGAILVPIVWSIKHLKDASHSDGKATMNLEKLKLFRQFYLLVVTYIYFTRIIVFLLDATLRFGLAWLGPFVTEMATLAFLCTAGYQFRPVPDNPFLRVDTEDIEKGGAHTPKLVAPKS